MYASNARLIILDADGTTIDAFTAIGTTFGRHGMDIGDLVRFQKRRNLFKYLGGLKEFPKNLQRQISKQKRAQLLDTLTEVYREEATLYPCMAELIRELSAAPGVKVGVVTRNITREPEETLQRLFARHDVDCAQLDFLIHVPLKQDKHTTFRSLREQLDVNPARAYACGDEHKDYLAATGAGMHPFMVSYGFEDFERLTTKFAIPPEVISRSPEEFRQRVLHALDMPIPDAGDSNNNCRPLAEPGAVDCA